MEQHIDLIERIVRLEAEQSWIKGKLVNFDGYFTNLGLMIISGLAAIAFMVFKQRTKGKDE